MSASLSRGDGRGVRCDDPYHGDTALGRPRHRYVGFEPHCLARVGGRDCNRGVDDPVHDVSRETSRTDARRLPERRYQESPGEPCYCAAAPGGREVGQIVGCRPGEIAPLASVVGEPELVAVRVPESTFDPAATVVMSAGSLPFAGEPLPDVLARLGAEYERRARSAVPDIGSENVEATVTRLARVVGEPTGALPTTPRPPWHDLVDAAPRVEDTLRVPIGLLQVPVPAPRPAPRDGLCRCERSRDPHAPTWCGTLPRAASRP